jgi:lipoprotein-anchoring transpeptidase ErfK/SrfK
LARRKGKSTKKPVKKHTSVKKAERILVFLIVAGIIAGSFLRIAIGKKVEKRFEEGKSLYSEKKFEDALNIFEKISKEYPRFRKVPIAYLHGICLNNLGAPLEAKVLWKKVVRGKPDSEYYPASLYALAHLEEIAGENEEAISSYNRILSEFGDSDIIPEVLAGLGNCLEQLKKWKDARKRYEEAFLSYPENPIVEKSKEKLGTMNIKLIFSPINTEDSIIYESKKGDTLEKIAKEFNTTVALIKQANRLEGVMLPSGKRLKITPGDFTIFVNADSNKLTLKLNGRFFKEYPIGTGKFGSTPIGTFKIVNKQLKPVWYAEDGIYPYGHPKNILGVCWMGMDKLGYGIHGTTQPETIGEHSSRGCIRLHNRDVGELYKLVTVGTPVTIIGTTSANVEK